MKRTFKAVYIAIACLVTGQVVAQQEPGYTQYMYNTLTVNPAYTGTTGALDATLLHRSQWTGIDGAPSTQAFTIQSPVSEKIGLGLSAINDKIGPSNETYVEGNFSYAIDLSTTTQLAFGLKAGMRLFNVDWNKGLYYDAHDVLLNNNINNELKPTIGAGVFAYNEKWYLGASVPNFMRISYYDDVQEQIDYARLHYYFMGGYVFDLSPSVQFKPAFLVKMVEGAPITADVSGNFLLQETVTLGVGYRWDDAINGMVGLQVSEKLFIGYAYDFTVSDLNKYSDGSHEFILRYRLKESSKQIRSPRFF